MIARTPRQPRTHLGVLGGGVIVHDEMDVERRRDTRVDVSQERQKLQMAMPGLAWREDLAMLHVQGGKGRGRAVPGVPVRHPLDVPERQRQARVGTLQRLDLALLVDAPYERVRGRMQVESDDVTLLDEARIRRPRDAGGPVRLHAEEPHRALDGTRADPRRRRDGPHAPVRRVRRRGRQHGPLQPGDDLVIVGPGAPAPRRIVQAPYPLALQTAAPVAHHDMAQVDTRGDVGIRPVGREQRGLGPLDQGTRRGARVGPRGELGALRRRQRLLEGAGASARYGGTSEGTTKRSCKDNARN